jgi:uncharacterized protein YbdZ (MbtH family)
MFDDDEKTIFKVVLNEEKQYSIWPQDRENPLGWYDEGKSGLKQECLDHIDKVWTDMRPLSLQKHMEAMKNRPAPEPVEATPQEQEAERVEDLVTRLCRGKHAVSVERYKTSAGLREAIEKGFVLVRFTQTRGGTEVGFKIDRQQSRIEPADSSGTTKLVGRFTLDGSRVECSVEIEGDGLEGVGCLTRVDADAAQRAAEHTLQ